MQLQGFIDWAVCSLRDLYPEHEARNMVDILLEERTGRKGWFAVAHPDFELCAAELPGLKDDVARLCTGEPLQYVLGFAWFYSRRFRVSPAVLIPRPETEILVDTVLSRLSDFTHSAASSQGVNGSSGQGLGNVRVCGDNVMPGCSPKILDLCTGSGCIAWTLALECPNASVTALDISRDALALARTQFPPAPAATVASPAAAPAGAVSGASPAVAPLATSADAVPHSSFAGCVSGASPTAAPLATSADAVPHSSFAGCVSGASPSAAPLATSAGAVPHSSFAGCVSGASPPAAPAGAVSGASPAAAPAGAVSGASPTASPVASPADAVSGASPTAAPAGAVSEGERVVFVEADVLDLSEKGISGDCSEMGLGKFDVIVSNPPYVMDKEKSQMRTNVLDYEPSIALFVPDDDPLIFYRAIAHHASRLLTDRGWGIVEINSLLANQTADCFRTAGFPTVNILPDLSGRPRFVHFSRI